MSLYHILRVVFAIAISGALGWMSLAAFAAVKVWQHFEAVEAFGPDAAGVEYFPSVLERAVTTMQGGSAVFLAAAIAGVLLGEVFRTRSLIFYAGATGLLTAVFAAAFWQEGGPLGVAPPAAALAMAGFVAGGVYWTIASPSDSHG